MTNTLEAWNADAKSYIQASRFSRNPLEAAILSVLSDVQKEMSMGLIARANFHANVAKVLVAARFEMKEFAAKVKADTDAEFGSI